MLLPSIQCVLFALAVSVTDEADQSISRKIKAGDHQAFKTFFDKYYDELFRFLRSKNTPPDIAEDLIQRAFVYIWEHRQKIDPDKSLRAYIFKIAYTRMLNYYRDTQKMDYDEALAEQQTSLTPEDTSLANDLQAAIDRSIEAMPPKRGSVFQLCFIEDFTYKEAASALDVSRKTVENHMGLALKDIRKSLKEFKE
jgi:RNA polymerase sigma-70 factor (ECF subfamily)